MTWRELIDTIIKNLPNDEWDKPALLFDDSWNNNLDGRFYKANGVEPYDFDENPQRDFSIVFNSEDGF